MSESEGFMPHDLRVAIKDGVIAITLDDAARIVRDFLSDPENIWRYRASLKTGTHTATAIARLHACANTLDELCALIQHDAKANVKARQILEGDRP